ncbi:MAG: hypothetical protein AABY36_08635 [Campylobacterota bacterium]|jgi:hypothetical protein
MRIILFIGISIFINGCSLLPYKTDFTCPNAIGGKCGNALESFNDSLSDIGGGKNEDSEYIRGRK